MEIMSLKETEMEPSSLSFKVQKYHQFYDRVNDSNTNILAVSVLEIPIDNTS